MMPKCDCEAVFSDFKAVVISLFAVGMLPVGPGPQSLQRHKELETSMSAIGT